jgi:hypothetical protein
MSSLGRRPRLLVSGLLFTRVRRRFCELRLNAVLRSWAQPRSNLYRPRAIADRGYEASLRAFSRRESKGYSFLKPLASGAAVAKDVLVVPRKLLRR